MAMSFTNGFKNTKIDYESFKLENVAYFINKQFEELTSKSIDDKGISEKELRKRENKKIQLSTAIKNCGIGDNKAKEYIVGYIVDLLTTARGINEENVDYIFDFNVKKISASDKFHILLLKYEQEYKKDALTKLFKKYDLDRLIYDEVERNVRYAVTAEDINNVYEKEMPKCSFEDKVQFIARKIYAMTKGLGAIDEIRDMNIDGLSVGVSGLPEGFIEQNLNDENEINFAVNAMKISPKSYEGIWLLFQGKEIHLEFMSMGSYSELQRVSENIYQFNRPGELSQSDGYKVNEMADGSRIVVLRPDFCESWCFFVRKFPDSKPELPNLMKGKNSEILYDLIEYLLKGEQVTAITGDQGTGKTTFLVAILKYSYAIYTLRVLEMAFETHLRKVYPKRNIVTVQETNNVSGQDAMDVLKKTNGSITIVGEVASDPVAAYMIQAGQVASKFTLFTHHAKTLEALIRSLRNSLLNAGGFANEKIAEEQVINVLGFDIHLDKDITGFRFCERITQCIPLKESEIPFEYDDNGDDKDRKIEFMKTKVAFYRKLTSGATYETRDIIRYNRNTHEYEFVGAIDEKTIKYMSNRMIDFDKTRFEKFIKKMKKESKQYNEYQKVGGGN